MEQFIQIIRSIANAEDRRRQWQTCLEVYAAFGAAVPAPEGAYYVFIGALCQHELELLQQEAAPQPRQNNEGRSVVLNTVEDRVDTLESPSSISLYHHATRRRTTNLTKEVTPVTRVAMEPCQLSRSTRITASEKCRLATRASRTQFAPVLNVYPCPCGSEGSAKLKKCLASGASTDAYTPKLWCFDSLMFLSETDPVTESISNLEEPGNIQESDIEISDTDNVIFDGTVEELAQHRLELYENDASSPTSGTPVNRPGTNRPLNSSTALAELLNTAVKSLEEHKEKKTRVEEEDDFDLFGKEIRKKVRPTPKQFEILLNFIQSNRILISRKTTPNEACNNEIKTLWLEITGILNAVGSGAFKTVDGWKKAWGEWKSHTKKKQENYCNTRMRQEVAPASSKSLSKLENQLMDLISWTTVAGIGGLPQGGIAPVEIETVEIVEPQLDVTIVGVADGDLEPKSKKRLRVDTEEPVPVVLVLGTVPRRSTTNKQVMVEETNTPRSLNKCEYNLSTFLENQKENEDRRRMLQKKLS
ncbi:hypothetical protein CBL_20377 [Carabus blaptoides fortunei]